MNLFEQMLAQELGANVLERLRANASLQESLQKLEAAEKRLREIEATEKVTDNGV